MTDRRHFHRISTTTGEDDSLLELIQATKRQDQNAFEQLYDLTVERTYGLALRIAQNPGAAEEIVGDSYLKVWRRAQQFDASRGSVTAWIMTICRSRALDTLRRMATSVQLCEGVQKAESLVDDTASQPDIVPTTQRESAIHSLLRKLDAAQRQLLTLAFYRGYSHQELADFTGLPLGTVKTQIRRAILKLKQHMAGISAVDLV